MLDSAVPVGGVCDGGAEVVVTLPGCAEVVPAKAGEAEAIRTSAPVWSAVAASKLRLFILESPPSPNGVTFEFPSFGDAAMIHTAAVNFQQPCSFFVTRAPGHVDRVGGASTEVGQSD